MIVWDAVMYTVGQKNVSLYIRHELSCLLIDFYNVHTFGNWFLLYTEDTKMYHFAMSPSYLVKLNQQKQLIVSNQL